MDQQNYQPGQYPQNQYPPVPVQQNQYQPAQYQNQMYQPGPFNSTGQQAMTYDDTPVEPPVRFGEPEPKKKKRIPKKLIIISSIVLVLLAAGGFAFYKFFMSPKQQVINAFANTYNVDYVTESFVLERRLGLYEVIFNTVQSGGVIKQTANIKVDDDQYKENFLFQKNNKLKLLSAEFEADTDWDDINGTVIGTPEETYFTMDELDGYIAIKNERIYHQLNKAPVFEDKDLDYHYDSDFNITWFDENIITFEDGRTTAISKESQEELEKQLYDSIQVKRDGSQEVTIGGKNKKAKKYLLTIEEDDVKDLIETYEEIYMDEIFDLEYSTYSGDLRDMLKERMEDQFEEIIDAVEDDFEMDVLLYRGKVAGFSFDWTFEDKDEEVDIKITAENSGLANILTDFKYTYETSYGDRETTATIEKETEESGDKVVETIKCVADSYYDDDYEIGYSVDITTEIDGNDFSFEIEEENSEWGDETLVSVSGQIDNVKKGKLLDLSIDDAEIEDEYFDKFDVTLYINADPSEADPVDVKSSADKCYVLEEDEDEIDEFIEDHYDED